MSIIPSLSVTVETTWADFSAAFPGVEGAIAPIDRRTVHYLFLSETKWCTGAVLLPNELPTALVNERHRARSGRENRQRQAIAALPKGGVGRLLLSSRTSRVAPG